MCDYCDCRSHPIIASLSEEHGVLLGVAAELGRAAAADDRPAADAAARELRALLASHADFEERGVFAELRAADVDAGYVGRFEEEHARVHALVDACGADGWQRAARDLVAVLGAHIDREETDLFPAAHQLLTPAQWQAIDGVRRAPAGATTAGTGSRPAG